MHNRVREAVTAKVVSSPPFHTVNAKCPNTVFDNSGIRHILYIVMKIELYGQCLATRRLKWLESWIYSVLLKAYGISLFLKRFSSPAYFKFETFITFLFETVG